MNKTYSDKLKDPRWQKKRLEIMQRDGFACQECHADDVHLNVHHSYYVSGRWPWNYPDWGLRTLCEACHENHHGFHCSQWMEWERIGSVFHSHSQQPSTLNTIGRIITHAESQGVPREEFFKTLLVAAEWFFKQKGLEPEEEF